MWQQFDVTWKRVYTTTYTRTTEKNCLNVLKYHGGSAVYHEIECVSAYASVKSKCMGSSVNERNSLVRFSQKAYWQVSSQPVVFIIPFLLLGKQSTTDWFTMLISTGLSNIRSQSGKIPKTKTNDEIFFYMALLIRLDCTNDDHMYFIIKLYWDTGTQWLPTSILTDNLLTKILMQDGNGQPNLVTVKTNDDNIGEYLIVLRCMYKIEYLLISEVPIEIFLPWGYTN